MFNILVVEDDKNLRKLITTYLQRNKYNTYEATNGEEALNVLDQSYIDLIVSDIMMPKMDGYELIKSLREAKYDVPILIITAKSLIEYKKEGQVFGIGAKIFTIAGPVILYGVFASWLLGFLYWLWTAAGNWF